jgi:hypothetical protein
METILAVWKERGEQDGGVKAAAGGTRSSSKVRSKRLDVLVVCDLL